MVFSYGCSGSGDAQVVNFAETIQTERPGDHLTRDGSLRVAVASMISPRETFVSHHQVLDYVGSQLGRDVELIQRKTYGEVNELFADGRIDLAFICSGPYATGKGKFGFELLAAPEIQGNHYYHSYLIVKQDSPFHRLEDLRGRVFAFTDPDSNTGRLVPTYWLAKIGERPETFFGKTIYSYSHDNSILAVARGLVDGASVDSLIWEYYHHKNPTLTLRTRIIKKSEPYGIPPLVTSKHVSPELKRRIREVLFSMHLQAEGQQILEELMIDRFIAPQEEWYDSIRQMKQSLAWMDQKSDAIPKPQN